MRADIVGTPPLIAAGDPFPITLDTFLAAGRALEPAARLLFVHPNTMRYRLRRIAEITRRDPWDARDLFALNVALILGRIDSTVSDSDSPPGQPPFGEAADPRTG